jgi:hypothetical protein
LEPESFGGVVADHAGGGADPLEVPFAAAAHDDGWVPVCVFLIDADGRRQRIADPSGGTFDAAGDFDRLIGGYPELPMWSSLYTEEDWTFELDDLAALLEELDVLEEHARLGPEKRGLIRLRALAASALSKPGLTLEWSGY